MNRTILGWKWASIALMALAVAAYGCDHRASALKAEGIQTTARLAFKWVKMISTGRGSSRAYTFTLYYFHRNPDMLAEEEAKKATNKALWEDSTLDINEKMDRWDLGTVELGDFTSVDVEVSRKVYDAHEEGDQIDIYYLPSDPSMVLPAEMVEE